MLQSKETAADPAESDVSVLQVSGEINITPKLAGYYISHGPIFRDRLFTAIEMHKFKRPQGSPI